MRDRSQRTWPVSWSRLSSRSRRAVVFQSMRCSLMSWMYCRPSAWQMRRCRSSPGWTDAIDESLRLTEPQRCKTPPPETGSAGALPRAIARVPRPCSASAFLTGREGRLRVEHLRATTAHALSRVSARRCFATVRFTLLHRHLQRIAITQHSPLCMVYGGQSSGTLHEFALRIGPPPRALVLLASALHATVEIERVQIRSRVRRFLRWARERVAFSG